MKQFGRIDIVFNNAGSVAIGEAKARSEETAHSMFDVNCRGAANVSRRPCHEYSACSTSLWAGSSCKSLQQGIVPHPAMATSKYGESVMAPCSSNLTYTNLVLEGFSKALWAEVGPEWNIKGSLSIRCQQISRVVVVRT